MKLRLLLAARYRLLAVCSGRGDCQLLDFLNELEGQFAKQADRMYVRLEETARQGPSSRSEICRKLSQEVWEFREGRVRVLWFYGEEPEIIICSHGFFKSSQKTPRSEVRRAIASRKRYFAALARGEIEILSEEDEYGNLNHG